MLISLLMWYLFGLVGSILVGLCTSLDGEGIDHKDILILMFFAIAGPFWLFVGIPFGYHWVNSLFGDKK